jgi:nucleoside-diphosphate-sugar epimerase
MADVDILVTGGNGYVGHHLVSTLLDRGDTVRVLALPGEDVSWLEARGVAVHRGDICRPDTLAAPMQGVEGVLNLAAMMHVWRPLREYRAVNVTGSENVARAALAGGARPLVPMSASSVYGMARCGPVDETFPLAPFPDPYPISKAEGDELVQRMVADAGLPAVIVRPDQIFGPGDRLHFAGIAARLRAGRSIVVGRGDNFFPLVYVSDVVQGLLLALDHEHAVGEAFNITNDAPLTQQEFLQAIASEIDAPPPRFHAPYHALYAAAWAAERVPAGKYTWNRPPLTRLGVAFLATDIRFSIDKARARLGYAPRVSLREGVRLAAAWEQAELAPRSAEPAGQLATASGRR